MKNKLILTIVSTVILIINLLALCFILFADANINDINTQGELIILGTLFVGFAIIIPKIIASFILVITFIVGLCLSISNIKNSIKYIKVLNLIYLITYSLSFILMITFFIRNLIINS